MSFMNTVKILNPGVSMRQLVWKLSSESMITSTQVVEVSVTTNKDYANPAHRPTKSIFCLLRLPPILKRSCI